MRFLVGLLRNCIEKEANDVLLSPLMGLAEPTLPLPRILAEVLDLRPRPARDGRAHVVSGAARGGPREAAPERRRGLDVRPPGQDPVGQPGSRRLKQHLLYRFSQSHRVEAAV